MAAKKEEEAIVSLVDVLEEDEELENEASAVLAGSDPDRCSYPEGYVKRQAVYACSTCTPKDGDSEPAGICLACSYKCHEGHDLYELYTKRNFRCDCGNSKFGEMECKLFPDKAHLNTENQYSHNFFGLYCTCNRPYPDVDDQVQDEMIQCVVCEDWLHGRHLGCAVPDAVELQEMVCEACMKKAPFLWTYAAHIAVPPVAKEEVCKQEEEVKKEEEVKTEEELKQEGELKKEGEVKKEGEKTEEKNTEEKASGSSGETAQVNGASGCKRKHSEVEAEAEVDVVGESSREGPAARCSLQELKLREARREEVGAVFWPTGWRSRLCSCDSCKRMFAGAAVLFLLDEGDTVLAYETKGKSTEEAGGSGGEELLMSAFNNLNRVQQLEIVYEYNDLKAELRDYLQRFAAEGKVVTPEDIRQFFEEQHSRKRRRANPGQYYCS